MRCKYCGGEIRKFQINLLDTESYWRHINPKTGGQWYYNCFMAKTNGSNYKYGQDATPNYFEVYLKQIELL